MAERIDLLEICKSKTWYETYDEAEKVARKFEARVYHCPQCNLYHCTSQAYSAKQQLNLVMQEQEYRKTAKRKRGT